MQLVRVQSPEGIKRIEISPKANLKELFETVQNILKVDGFGLFKERNLTKEVRYNTPIKVYLKAIYIRFVFVYPSRSTHIRRRKWEIC